MLTAAEIIARFSLVPLPGEGGFYTRTWTSSDLDESGRPAGTAIYFLITAASFSALHRLRTDEIWHFYAGRPIDHVQLTPTGPRWTRLGSDFLRGEVPSLAVPKGRWQGARPALPGRATADAWSLVGCTLAPGWAENEFELGQSDLLCREFPSCAEVIPSLV